MSRSQLAMNRAEGDHIPWGWVALNVVGLEIALVLSAFAWVAIYTYLSIPITTCLTTKNTPSSPSPIVSVTVGIPYLFLACRWVGRKAGHARRNYELVGMVHLIHHRCAADFGGRPQRVHRGNGDAFTCDENAGRILRRQGRVERCPQDPASCC